MKKHCLLIISLFFFISSFSQGKITGGDISGFKVPILETIDTAYMILHYQDQIMHDTVNHSAIIKNFFIQQIGHKVSKYADYYDIKKDSMLTGLNKLTNNSERIALINKALQYGNTYGSCTFKNYPNNKIITGTTRVGSNFYMSEEPAIVFKWKLENETKTILKYSCKKAKTQFAGRNYIAWYTPDIPINNGPWKFSGLPGLILRVEDDRGQISFDCVAIEKPEKGIPIFIKKEHYIKLKKKTYLDLMRKFSTDYTAYMSNYNISNGLAAEAEKRMEENKNKKYNYNPIEIEY